MKKRKIDKQSQKDFSDFLYRTEQFIEEVKIRGGINNLYKKEHTNNIVKLQGVTIENFYKLFKRMLNGTGLYSNPILLSAVLKDMAYSADLLFGCPFSQSNHLLDKLSPSVSMELRDIISTAFQQMSKKPYRQLGLKKRIKAAISVLSIVKMIQQNNNFSFSLQFLFFSYSSMDTRLYPHSQIITWKL